MFILRNHQNDTPSLESLETPEALNAAETSDADLRLSTADELLRLYVDTENSSPLMPLLKQARDFYIDDLDLVGSAAEVTGLLVWLMDDYGIDYRGETLEATADRLSDIDIEADTDKHTDLIFHLKDAVERLYDLEMEDW